MTDRYLEYLAATYDKERHEEWINLLDEISSTHGIVWEETPIRKKAYYTKEPETTEEEIWEEELKRNRAIIRNDPQNRTPSEKFKAASGNYQISGNIMVRDSEHGIIHGTRHSAGTEFLEQILDDGEAVLEALAATGKQGKSTHDRIQEAYADRAEGRVFKEYSVGKAFVDDDMRSSRRKFAENMLRKQIDIVVKKLALMEIVDVKGEFDADKAEKALGQLLIYEDFYLRDHPDEKVELKVIFPEPSFGQYGQMNMVGRSEAIASIVSVFNKYDISVLFMSDAEEFREVNSDDL